jgi:hypothetical protein
MPPRTSPAKGIWPALAVCLTLGVAGCGSDDIQFNGGIFDAVGLSDSARAKSTDAKVAERPGLVVPPSLDRLPPPGEAAPQSDQLATLKDPDAMKKVTHAELERQQAEYCKVNYEQAKARGDDATASNAEGPLGPCRPSVLTAIKKYNAGDSEDSQ